MELEALPDDFVDSLLAEKPRGVKERVRLDCKDCGAKLNKGYCPNCDVTPDLQLCQWCGYCEDPEHCVWSVQCPKCYAPHMQHCTASDGRVEGLHQERWDYARKV